MKAKDIREMTDEELTAAYAEASEQMFKLKLQQTQGQLENPAKITQVRKDIARIQTVRTERSQAGV